jgi:hypothetical protein
MSRIKPKRCKSHTPRPSIAPALLFTLPLTAKQHDTLAMQMHMQVDTFILAPTTATGTALAHTMTIISRAIELQSPTPLDRRTDPDAIAIVKVGKALDSVMSRFDRMQRYGVSECEKEALRSGSGALDGAIGHMPQVLIQVATEITEKEERATWDAVRAEREAMAA